MAGLLRIAVLSLCRDRLEYTKVCFQSLRENAGCRYDHYVLDQGSKDKTPAWLEEISWQTTYEEAYNCPLYFWLGEKNIGYAAGMNFLLDRVKAQNWRDYDNDEENGVEVEAYDVLVTFDNDCKVLTPGTLQAVAEATFEADRPAFLSPLILGLRHRPPIVQTVGRIGKTRVVGGIFRSIPPQLLQAGFRFDETGPLCGDEKPITDAVQNHGAWCGYLLDYEAEHYRTTDGQHEDYPEYFARRRGEGGTD